jgi:hypothetical protein
MGWDHPKSSPKGTRLRKSGRDPSPTNWSEISPSNSTAISLNIAQLGYPEGLPGILIL